MKDPFHSLIALLLLLALGCTGAPLPETEPVPARLVAVREEAVRTAYTPDGSFSWESGDEIEVLYRSGGYRFFRFSTEGSGPEAVFSGLVTGEQGGDYQALALYPPGLTEQRIWNEGDHEYFPVYLPAEVEGSGASAIPLVASAPRSGSSGRYRFRPISAVIRFDLSGLPAESARLTIVSEGNGVSGEYWPVWDAQEKLYYITWAYDHANNRKTYRFTPEADGTYSFYLPFGCIQPWNPFTFILSDAYGRTLFTKTATLGSYASQTLQRGKMYVVRMKVEAEVPPPSEYDVLYQPSTANFCNPERGLYVPHIKYFRYGGLPEPSSAASLHGMRSAGKTLSFSEFYLHDFVYKDLSAAALGVIRSHLAAHREAGVKTVLRFAYSDSYADSAHPWDAPLEQTLRHVEQLKPLLQEYADIIYVVQYGFVGSWGEGYYTDNYGMEPRTEADYWSRRQLMNALLEAVPENRQVAVRYPLYKRGILGMAVGDTITAETAFGPSQIARVAAFNDCFVSSANDVGTYFSEDDRMMWATETHYVSMGGETCAADPAYCACDKTYTQLERYHWSYLNEAYHTGTHDIWRSGGCFDDIVRRLGYRLVLKGASFEGTFAAGESFTVRLALENVGFASLINPRPLQWVLENTADPKDRFVLPSPQDPRAWKGGHAYVFEESFTLPALRSGAHYKLGLALPDAASTLSDKPEFSVRFANEGVWDAASGVNILQIF